MLYGIGVGPGDAGLITKKAMEIVEKCPVIILPAREKESCRAYKIAELAGIDFRKKQLYCADFPMTKDMEKRKKQIEVICERIGSYIEKGEDAAFLTIGDPMIYSTFSYVLEYAKERGWRAEVVSGVPSFAACAAAIPESLVSDGKELHIFTGQSDFRNALRMNGTKVFMKAGSFLPRLKEEFARLSPDKYQIYAVENCGLLSERIFRGLEGLPDDGDYMMTIIVSEI